MIWWQVRSVYLINPFVLYIFHVDLELANVLDALVGCLLSVYARLGLVVIQGVLVLASSLAIPQPDILGLSPIQIPIVYVSVWSHNFLYILINLFILNAAAHGHLDRSNLLIRVLSKLVAICDVHLYFSFVNVVFVLLFVDGRRRGIVRSIVFEWLCDLFVYVDVHLLLDFLLVEGVFVLRVRIFRLFLLF